MSHSPSPADASAPPADASVVIAVVRSGGIAGISRRWQIVPAPSDAGEWIALIDRCPWGEAPDTQNGADRFVWNIRVRTADERRARQIGDSALTGPWRELVDAVRAATDTTPEPRNPV